MVHVIDHDDLTTRPWVCTTCGCTCLSKSPWQRNTHGEGVGDMLQRMYLSHLRNISSAKMTKAHPPRPKEDARVYMSAQGNIVDREVPFCLINHEQDIAIYITPRHDIIDTGKPIESNAKQLLAFFKVIRDVDQATLEAYACGELNGGHSWTDDPAEIESWQAKRKEPEQ